MHSSSPASSSLPFDGSDVADFIDRNPLVLVAGATALGLIVAGAVSRTARRDSLTARARGDNGTSRLKAAVASSASALPTSRANALPLSERLGMVLDRISSLDPRETSQDPWLGVRNFMENVLRP